MIEIAEINAGDRVSFYCERFRVVKTRTVKTVKDGWIMVLHGKSDFALSPGQIKSLVKMGRYKTGRSPLDLEMRRKGVNNIQLAVRSGYSTRSVCDVRLGRKVKPVTLTDITQALGEM